jgi:hypothetical protein
MMESSLRDNPRLHNVVSEEKFLRSGRLLERMKELSEMNRSYPILRVGCSQELAEYFTLREYAPLILIDLYRWPQFEGDYLTAANEVAAKSNKRIILFGPEGDVVVSGENPWVMNGAFYSDKRLIRREIIDSVETVGPPLPNFFEEEYGWLRGIYFLDGEGIDDVIARCPIAGIDPGLANKVKKVGISSGSDEMAIKINKLLLELSRDPKFPSDLRTETIFDIISAPSVATDPFKVANVLTAMGADKSTSAKIAMQITNLTKSFTFINRTNSYSTADQIIGHMDLSFKNYNRLVSVDAVDDLQFEQVLSSLAFLHLLTKDDSLPINKVHVRLVGDAPMNAAKHIMGRLFEDVHRYQDIYPHGIMSD